MSITDITSFLGLAGYYWKLIENFLRITCPMTALQKKANKFLWTTKCEESFQNLKKLLMTTLILRIVNPDGDFVFCMDASKEGFGGVLLHNDPAICYESQNLKEHEKNYPMFDLASAAIIHALKMWRHYLLGRKFLLKTDNMSLKYLFKQPDLNVRQAIWLALIASTISS